MPIEELLTNVNSLTRAISTSRMCPAAMTAIAGSRSSGMCRSFAKWFRVPNGSTPSAAVESTRAEATLLTVPSPPAATTMAAWRLAVRAAADGSSPSPSAMISTSRPTAPNKSTSSVARCGRPLAIPARAFTMTTIVPASGIRVHRSRICCGQLCERRWKHVGTVRGERQGRGPQHRRQRQRAVQMRKKIAAARRFPAQVQTLSRYRDEQKAVDAGKMPLRSLTNLLRRRKVDEAVPEIDRRAGERAGRFAGAPQGGGNELVDDWNQTEGFGEVGIRTLDSLTTITVFETAAFDHSATSPVFGNPRF